MNWIKQSWAFQMKNPRESLLLAIFTLAALYAASLIHFAGVLIASLFFVMLQAFIFQSDLKWDSPKKHFREIFSKKALPSFVLLAVFSSPTTVMMGSAIGLLQGHDSWVLVALMVGVFSTICSLTYLLIAHAIGFFTHDRISLRKALTLSIRGFLKKKTQLLGLSFFLALVFIASALPFGAGLIFTLPLQFYVYYFSYQDLYAKVSTTPA